MLLWHITMNAFMKLRKYFPSHRDFQTKSSSYIVVNALLILIMLCLMVMMVAYGGVLDIVIGINEHA